MIAALACGEEMSIGERGIWHESGHAVVALCRGFSAADIWFKNGNLEASHARFPGMLQRACFLLAAAGAASEKLKFGDYDPKASSADAVRISELEGTTIEDYLPEAIEILEKHKQELELMAGELAKKWNQSLFSGRPNPLRLMSADEVNAIHSAMAGYAGESSTS